ncbi:MAG: HD domain-containing protein [Gammaproteobacteria bacterium]|nr:HD domain-containing protein [Gammaproteobacteria bacterium]
MRGLLTERFIEALGFATRLHDTQLRKGSGVPYFAHPLAVASLVLEAGGTEDEAIAALLHDGPEDQGGLETLEEIRSRFGDEVARIVAECSDSFAAQKSPWLERKANYLRNLETASPSALLVSCADKLHNSRSIVSDYRRFGEVLWERFRGGREGTLWYYRELVQRFASRHEAPEMFAELRRTVAELEAMTAI